MPMRKFFSKYKCRTFWRVLRYQNAISQENYSNPIYFAVPSGDGPGMVNSSRPMEFAGAIQTRAGKTSASALKCWIQARYIRRGCKSRSNRVYTLLVANPI